MSTVGTAARPAAAAPARHRALWLTTAALLSLTVTVQSLRDPDVWWHLALGRLITAGGIPSSEPFSFLPAAHPWVEQSWLYDATLARLVGAGPGAASLAMGALASAALVIAALATPRATRAPGPWVVICVLASALVAGPVLGVRSQVVTVAGVAATLFIVSRWREGGRRIVWALPPLFLVWANLHTGFVAGLALVLVALVAHRPRPGSPPVARRRLALATGIAALLTVVNPHGVGIYPYIAETFGNPTLTQSIVEWMSPDFHDAYARLFELLAIGLVAVWVASDGPEVLDLVLAGGAVVATLQAQRNLGLVAVIALPQLLRYGTEAGCRAREALRGRWPATPSARRGTAMLASLTAAVATGTALAVGPGLSSAAASRHEASSFPRAAVDEVAARHPGVRVYTTYELGGYLAYRLPVGRVVFIYGESAIFGDAGLQRYLDIHLLRPGWADAIRRHGFGAAIAPAGSQEVSALRVIGWREECGDNASDTVVMVPPAGDPTARTTHSLPVPAC